MTNQEYLQHAEECDRLAAMARLASTKAAMLDTARMWRSLVSPKMQPATSRAPLTKVH